MSVRTVRPRNRRGARDVVAARQSGARDGEAAAFTVASNGVATDRNGFGPNQSENMKDCNNAKDFDIAEPDGGEERGFVFLNPALEPSRVSEPARERAPLVSDPALYVFAPPRPGRRLRWLRAIAIAASVVFVAAVLAVSSYVLTTDDSEDDAGLDARMPASSDTTARASGAADKSGRLASSPDVAAPLSPPILAGEPVAAPEPAQLQHNAALETSETAPPALADLPAQAPVAPPIGADEPAAARTPAQLQHNAASETSETAPPALADLPAQAPARVVLNIARNDPARALRASRIAEALEADGLTVAERVAAGAPPQRAAISYYFRSDRDAAVRVGRLLNPLLGDVNPEAQRVKGSRPQPGAIEISVP